MAYMDFSAGDSAVATIAPWNAVPSPALAADFAPLEWTVIALARHEPLGGGEAPGRVRRLLAVLFGDEPTTPLADPRLEALRRVTAALWHRRTPGASALAAFHDAGFTLAHLALLRRRVAAVAGAAA